MTRTDRQMVLTLFMLPAGYHKDSWRLAGSRAEELPTLPLIADMARNAERAKLHACFFGDLVTAQTIIDGNMKNTGLYEPMTALSALAAVTERIGLIGTISTSFTEPYNVARQLTGLDYLSGGRAGWNIVTSFAGATNFGLDALPLPADRYRRATEHVDVVERLWDSWSDEAVVVDREASVWARPDEMTAIDHEGEFFKVRGPLNMPRPIQGHPVKVVAGSSPAGLELGARVADAIYTVQPDRERAITFAREFKALVAGQGRNPDHVKVIPGILPIVGETQAEAEAIAQELADHIDYAGGRVQMARMLRIDLDDLDLDEQVPAERFARDEGHGSRFEIYRRMSVEQGMTLREMIIEDARAGGHKWIVGTAASIADHMIDWFEAGACDGFSLNPPHTPAGVERICELLVPELQERGYFRTDYVEGTLRDNLGLERPSADGRAADGSLVTS